MTYTHPDSLVETTWLAERLVAPDIRILDCSYYLPNQTGDARADYSDCHIPGAQFFDIDEIADTASPLPHMLPSQELFASRMRKMGIGDGSKIICYDSKGMVFAARVWWTFRVFGHRDVAILNGGLPKWLREGRPTEARAPAPRERHFTARTDNTLVRDFDQVRANIASRTAIVLDARAPGRFQGHEPEPRAGLRSGHIPGSANLPYADLFDAKTGTILAATSLREKFIAHGVTPARPVITTCGSGISAAALAFALHLIGHKDVAVYDGSWAEWGSRADAPIEI